VQTTTVIFMVLVLGVLWGGFAVLLIHSMKTDRKRGGSAGASEGDRG